MCCPILVLSRTSVLALPCASGINRPPPGAAGRPRPELGLASRCQQCDRNQTLVGGAAFTQRRTPAMSAKPMICTQCRCCPRRQIRRSLPAACLLVLRSVGIRMYCAMQHLASAFGDAKIPSSPRRLLFSQSSSAGGLPEDVRVSPHQKLALPGARWRRTPHVLLRAFGFIPTGR